MISLLIPTRERQGRLMRLLENIQKTCESRYLDFEILYWIDNDDKKTDVRELVRGFPEFKQSFFYRDRPKYMTDTYNELVKYASGNIIFYGADDIEFMGKGWISDVIEMFSRYPDEILLYFYSDREEPPLHGFISKKCCNIMGGLCPEKFEHGYIDYWLKEVFQSICRSARTMNNYIGHHHFHSDIALLDYTYRYRSMRRDKLNRTCDNRDRDTFDRETAFRKEIAAKLGAEKC